MSSTIDNGYDFWFEQWNTHEVLDLTGSNPANNTTIIGYWAHVGPGQPTNQKWSAKTLTNDTTLYTLTCASPKSILTLPKGATTVVGQTTAVTDGSQYWSFVPATEGAGTSSAKTPAFKIKNQLSGTFIDIQGDGGNLTPVVSLTDAGGPYEHRWIAWPAGKTPTSS